MTERGPTYYAVPKTARVSVCREPTCGKTLYWIQSPATGKPMPIDCEADRNCTAPFSNEDGVGVNHVVTCTVAGRFPPATVGAPDAGA
jgi:hypothetical protein